MKATAAGGKSMVTTISKMSVDLTILMMRVMEVQ